MTPPKVNISSIFDRFKNRIFESDCPLCLCETAGSGESNHSRIDKTSHSSPLSKLNQSLICNSCASRLPFLVASCEVCAMPISSSQQICGQCLQKSPSFDKTIAAFHYEPPISDFIQNIKYRSRFDCLPLLTNTLANVINRSYNGLELPSLLIPVPLHKHKLMKRGFNQATEITKSLSKTLSIDYSNSNALRIKATRAQADLSATERNKNLKNAFKISGDPPTHCAIVDDVMTTGSTVNTLSKALKSAGVEKVDIWCLARAFPVD